MAYSTVYASKKYILAQLQALESSTLTNVGVFQGEPNWQNPIRDNVYVGDIDATLDWAELGARRHDEQDTITLMIEVFRPGTDASQAEDRWWAIEQAIETALAGDITLSNSVVAARIGRIRQTLTASSDGYLATGTATVEIHARF